MATNSSIEWTGSTWNPVTGCTKITTGCLNCYAERMTRRLKAMGQKNYKAGFDKVVTHEHVLELPLSWKKSQTIFVNSMSDLFHKDVPLSFIKKVFAVMEKADWHTFQILTKRGDILAKHALSLPWPSNVWMGVTVESAAQVERIEHLRSTDAKVKFLSIEPLLSAMPVLNLKNIDWVIVGGESGPGARPMKKEWVTDLRDQCLDAEVPFFFKQWGGVHKKLAGRKLEGKLWNQMPVLA